MTCEIADLIVRTSYFLWAQNPEVCKFTSHQGRTDKVGKTPKEPVAHHVWGFVPRDLTQKYWDRL